jgi:AcrR family transcriptional regulator
MAAKGPETLEEGDAFDSLPGIDRIDRLLVEEMGAEMAAAYARTRTVYERWTQRHHPHEGLRERKKRLTRQQISDAATTLFVVRGFERVTVAQIAEIVGVSEKTVYNYFPTKESLVFDRADEGRERLASALRERGPSESPTRVILRELAEQNRDLEELPDESQMLLPLFAEMIATTPALRAAWLELQDRLTVVVTAELAAHADVDPLEPEPMIAARAVVGLIELSFQSRIRHIEAGLHGAALGAAIAEDLERAARLLDTGLWSFTLMTKGARSRAQLREAAVATEEARKQVMDALKQARSAWREMRDRTKDESRQQREEAKRSAKAGAAAVREQAKRATKEQVASVREEAKRTAKTQAAVAKQEAKRVAKAKASATIERARRAAEAQIAEARTEADRASTDRQAPTTEARRAYESFHRAMVERHEAIRSRQTHEER